MLPAGEVYVATFPPSAVTSHPGLTPAPHASEFGATVLTTPRASTVTPVSAGAPDLRKTSASAAKATKATQASGTSARRARQASAAVRPRTTPPEGAATDAKPLCVETRNRLGGSARFRLLSTVRILLSVCR